MTQRVVKVNANRPDQKAMEEAAACIRRGGVIVYPTETLYGIGADAFDGEAVRRVQAVKQREEKKPVLVIIDTEDRLMQLTSEVSEVAGTLIRKFWPGPLTLVFAALPTIPAEITQGTNAIGVRLPSSALCRELVRSAGRPITSTSANLSGQPTPRTVREMQSMLREGVDLFLDAGELPESKPSTVVDVSTNLPRLLRKGAIPTERLVQVVPNLAI
jgi:L-threonylcarbamoyladenylate synthase